MHLESPTRKLDEKQLRLVNELVADMGVECVGVDDEGFIGFQVFGNLSSEQQAAIAQEIMRVISGEGLSEELKRLREATSGISVFT